MTHEGMYRGDLVEATSPSAILATETGVMVVYRSCPNQPPSAGSV
jgi:hypothetical protein